MKNSRGVSRWQPARSWPSIFRARALHLSGEVPLFDGLIQGSRPQFFLAVQRDPFEERRGYRLGKVCLGLVTEEVRFVNHGKGEF